MGKTEAFAWANVFAVLMGLSIIAVLGSALLGELVDLVVSTVALALASVGLKGTLNLTSD